MLRQVYSSVPTNYLYRCTLASAACAYKPQLSHYSTAPPADKKSQKPQKPEQQQKQQKQQSNTNSNTTTTNTITKPTTTTTPTTTNQKVNKSIKPTTSIINPNLPSPHTSSSYENLHPVYDFSKSKEDRVLEREDLVGFVSQNAYNNDRFKDSVKIEDMAKVAGKLKERKFSLYGVFDGHQGDFAAEYVKQRLPYELVSAPEFAAGNYEAAIKTAYANVHKALLSSKGYSPQGPKYDFTSGTTASIVLVTPETSYFAQLGNTSILVKQDKQKLPSVLFPPSPSDLERLRTSDMFIMVNHAPVSDPKDKREFWQDSVKAGEELSHGLSNLKTLGSLGDSLYEPATLNRFLAAFRAYKQQAQLTNAKSTKLAKAAKNNDHSGTFRDFAKHVKESGEWKELRNHVVVPKARDETSWLINGFLEGTFQIPSDVKHSSMKREPEVKAIPNSQLQYAHIVTDGVLVSKFNADQRAMTEIDRIVTREAGKERDVVGPQYSNWVFGSYGDDISSVTVKYSK